MVDVVTSHRYGRRFDRARLIVLARDGYRCHWCGGEAKTADHLVPRIEGGSDEPWNLVASCQRCNSARSLEWVKARARARRRGVPPQQQPPTTGPTGALA